MITLTQIRTLDLATATAPGRRRHLSAASGLVCVQSTAQSAAQSTAYVIADDELHLGVFSTDTAEPGSVIRLFEGVLPDEPKHRKKAKPDLEAIALLPAAAEHPHGALLVLGSGSRPQRHRGAILYLDRSGGVHGVDETLDLSPIYAALEGEFEKLNIEGAVVLGGELCLLQRGNKKSGRNAVIRFALRDFLHALRSPRPDLRPSHIGNFDLGEIDGVPLSFTDAAVLPDGRMVFTAAAEDTDNPYDDGGCLGSAIGIIAAGALQGLERVDRVCKLEGVHASIADGAIRLLLVSDADDADVPAELFATSVPDFSGQ
jgi:hypothetical protein